MTGHYSKVIAYSGYKANERPLSFTINPAASRACLDSPVNPSTVLRAVSGLNGPGNDDFEVFSCLSNIDDQRLEVRDLIYSWAEPEKDLFK